MKYIFGLMCVVSMLSSCKEQEKSRGNFPQTDTSALAHPEEYHLQTPLIADSSVTGVFQGIFPCVDCDGIQQTVLFHKDHTYTQEQIKWDKNEEPTRGRGQWRINGSTIELFQNKQLVAEMILKGDSLFATKISGILLNDSGKYLLTRHQLAAGQPVWNKKKLKGIDFVGMGNEPFWNVEIIGTRVSFKLVDWKKPIYASMGEMEKNVDSTAYYLQTANKKWSLKILPHLCSDGMSDFIYEYQVEVNYEGTIYKGCGIKL